MPTPSQVNQRMNIDFVAAKRLEYEKVALTQQAMLDLTHERKPSPAADNSATSTALSSGDIDDPYAFLRECDTHLARLYEDEKKPTYTERQALLHIAERALAVWHEYILAHETTTTQTAVTRRYLELAREWSKTVGSSEDLAGSELRRYPLRRPRVSARPLSHPDRCTLRTDPNALRGKPFLLYPNATKRRGLWCVIGIDYKEMGVRQGRPIRRGSAAEDVDVVYEVMFEECERAVDVQGEVVWSLIEDSWYYDESA